MLVGGTSLALQLGHRKSDDLDFFTDSYFDLQEIKSTIITNYPDAQLLNERPTGLSYILPVRDTANSYRKLDIYNWAVKFIKPNIHEGNFRLASLEDITALKLDAISFRKEQKDYIDLAVLLTKFTLSDMLKFYQEKFPNNDLRIVLSHLRNFKGVEESPKPEMLIDFDLKSTLNLIIDHTRDYTQAKLQFKEEQAKKKDQIIADLIKRKQGK